jgi:hypothetical protein
MREYLKKKKKKPDQLFIYYIEDPLVVTSINSGSWGG